jgi:hypothetical protein
MRFFPFRGGKPQVLNPGDTVNIPPDTMHWKRGTSCTVAPGHQRGDHNDRKADDVRYRQNAVDSVRLVALRARRLCAEQQVAVGQHYPLGIAGRARGIDEGGDLPRPIRLDRLRRGLAVERPDAERSQRAKRGNIGVVALRVLARSVGDFDRIKTRRAPLCSRIRSTSRAERRGFTTSDQASISETARISATSAKLFSLTIMTRSPGRIS